MKNLCRFIGVIKARNDENLAELITISLKHAALNNMQFLLTDLNDKKVHSEKLTLLVIYNIHIFQRDCWIIKLIFTLYFGNLPTRFTKKYIFFINPKTHGLTQMLSNCQICCRNDFKGRYTFLDLTIARAGKSSNRVS